MTEKEKRTPVVQSPRALVDRSVAQGELGSGGLEREVREENSPTPVSLVKTKLISQRKLEANRANAKKSTGPRTARGKAFSRRNAVCHGLTSTTVLFHCDGTPHDPELRQLWESLHEKFGSGDAITEMLIDNVVADWAHHMRAVRLEQWSSELDIPLPDPGIGLASFHRYIRKSQRSLLRTLRLLHRRFAESAKAGRGGNEQSTIFAKRTQ
jgi:hypothetical protein